MQPEQRSILPNGTFVAEDLIEGANCWLRDGQVYITFNCDPGRALVLESDDLHQVLSALAPFDDINMRVIPPTALRRNRICVSYGIAFLAKNTAIAVFLPKAITQPMADRFFKAYPLVPLLVGRHGTIGNEAIFKRIAADPTRN
jgi:hypothetical protein